MAKTRALNPQFHVVVIEDEITGAGAMTATLEEIAALAPPAEAIEGPMGPAGVDGATGPTGPQGPPGPAGSAPVQTYSAVTQTGGKTASVWSDSDTTTITTSTDVVNANDDFTFTFSNSRFKPEKHPRITVMGTSHPLYYFPMIVPLNGASDITVKNTSGSPMGEAIVLRVTIS